MRGIRCVLRDSNRIGIQFLFTDLDVASSFLTVAATSGDLANKQRNWKNARIAHDAIRHLLPRLMPSDEELLLLNERLYALRLRLQALGEVF